MATRSEKHRASHHIIIISSESCRGRPHHFTDIRTGAVAYVLHPHTQHSAKCD